ncbi:MAG: hypothetical protein BHV77_09575 [Bacteroides sp. 43_108]|nr:MAG: hypothetical protein BHV77_09575 [Bacteroides sp. 43_108]
MNQLKHFICPISAALLLATAACTKDELADGNRLPEGQYPLEIARITLGVEGGEAQPWGTPQTRVSEIADGNSSKFDADDKFAVQIDGKEEVGTYTVQDNNTVKAETPLYWSDTGEHTVTAWYLAKSGTIDLGNQSQSLAYLLYATGTGDYQTPVTLTFAHQLAKVRVTPTGDALGEVQSLQLYTYTQCTYEKGKAGQGSQEGWIEMKKCEYTENGATITCWEANVVPGYTITKLQANGTEERNLSAAITPEAGKFYNITLDKNKGYTDDGQGNYTVTTADGLMNVAELVNGGKTDINITLDTDLDLTGKEWTPIGNYEKQYTGTFDGNGKTITGLTFNQPETNNVGLIGNLGENGMVQDVKLDKVNIKANNNVGGIVGTNKGGSIIGCSVSGGISGVRQVGGVMGWFTGNGIATACYHVGSVSGSEYVGGVAGNSSYGSLTACYHVGNVTGSQYVGGVTGIATGSLAKVIACYWNGYDGNGIGLGRGEATQVDGTTVTWKTAVDAMNAALQNAGSEWRYELTGELPTLKK